MKQRYKKETVWETVLCKKEQIWAKKKSISGGSQIYNYLIYRLLLVFVCSCFLWKCGMWFWKQITTVCLFMKPNIALFIRSKIQFFESKSQHVHYHMKITHGCLSDQRYNFLKANHNQLLAAFFQMEVVYQIKDTIFWKQITTYTHN